MTIWVSRNVTPCRPVKSALHGLLDPENAGNIILRNSGKKFLGNVPEELSLP